MSTLVTGGTGWIGSRLTRRLPDAIVVTRDAARARESSGGAARRLIECNLSNGPIDASELGGVTAAVNLMGDHIGEGRWTTEKKQRIRNSRVAGTRHLVDSLLRADSRPHTLISASAIGYYGDRGEEVCTESTSAGGDFLAHVCEEWEEAAMRLADADVRVVCLRFGHVLGAGGGAMARLLPVFRFGFGGRLGSGRQWMSWIHIDDLVELILFTLANPHVRGAVNAVSPNPLRNIDFTKSLGAALHRPAILAVPKFALRIALGEFAEALVASQRVESRVLEPAGFEYSHPTIESAWEEIV